MMARRRKTKVEEEEKEILVTKGHELAEVMRRLMEERKEVVMEEIERSRTWRRRKEYITELLKILYFQLRDAFYTLERLVKKILG